MFPKLIEWYTSSSTSALAQWRCSNEERKFTMTNFAEKYQQIKDRYAHNLIKNWPESTDPLKFVYEELAIAAYLCLVTMDMVLMFEVAKYGNGLGQTWIFENTLLHRILERSMRIASG
eukprot:m.18696 g.18696  ORF g.18696 m.18696 type:complete len:118 (+) comp8351_c0_seq1:372-725(+)